MKRLTSSLLAASLSPWLLNAAEPANSQVTQPAPSLSKDLIKKMAHITPRDNQYNWQAMEFTAFLHFGINTFTDREWGSGNENPNTFNPTRLDTDQWCKFLAENGFKMAIITAKHHDGFCIWQTRHTHHSVASSQWRDGKGDVVADLAKSCKKYGLKLGVYLSPADLYQMKDNKGFGAGLYGNGSKTRKRSIPELPEGAPAYTSSQTFEVEVDDYNAYFMNQLYELLTEYGEIAEVWFDGAHPSRKGNQQYRKDLWEKLIRSLQPNIIIHGNNFHEMRWVGNEAGFAREEEWSVLPKAFSEKNPWKKNDLGSRSLVQQTGESEFYWLPAETDVSIRPGWFYHKAQDDKVKSPDHLFKIYLESIGRNSTLLLNYPPNREGLIHPNDVASTSTFYQRLQTALSVDFTRGATISASHSSTGHEASTILDDDPTSYWTSDAWQEKASLEISLPQPATFNMIALQEHIQVGQRIESFRIEGWIDEQWQEISAGGTIGYKRILKLIKPVTCQKLRLNIDASRYAPTLTAFSLHYYQDSVHPPVVNYQNGQLQLAPPHELTFLSKRHTIKQEVDTSGYQVRYTTDGSEVSPQSPLYTKALELSSGTVKAKCFVGQPLRESSATVFKVHYPHEQVKVLERPNKENQALVLELQQAQQVTGFSFTPGKQRKTRCLISQYSLYASNDQKNWTEIKKNDSFGNIVNDPTERERSFKATQAKYLKFVWHKSENRRVTLPDQQLKIFVK